jgi:hypothetical protein
MRFGERREAGGGWRLMERAEERNDWRAAFGLRTVLSGNASMFRSWDW